MGAAVDPAFESLHRLRIRGLVPVEQLPDATALAQQSLVIVAERGCMLTAEGLQRHEELLAQSREALDLESLARSYERFLSVNQRVKEICAGWQIRRDEPDALFMVVEDLAELIDRALPSLRRAGHVVPRFGSYESRLLTALENARGGNGRFITDPKVDSIHSIWFECHEDYLTTLGRDRESEGSY
jgi:hypothetical protein